MAQNLDSLVPTSPHTELCKTCRKVDLPSFFQSSFILHPLGSLRDLRHRHSCPTCAFFVQSICRAWNIELDAISTLPAPINCFAKNVWWAQTMEKRSPSSSKCTRHYRMALGVDWIPTIGPLADALTVAELDFVPETKADSNEFARRVAGEKINAKLIKSWLDNCLQFHDHEDNAAVSIIDEFKPKAFRVIDVIDGKLIQLKQYERYVALSYVWGSSGKISRRKYAETLDDSALYAQTPIAIDNSALPQTIKDAIEVTAMLGQRYLWVDAICINQACPEDRAFQITRMNSIYESALLTIVAAAGEDADAGLPGVHAAMSIDSLIEFETGKGRLALAYARPSLADQIRASPWNTRGWTFQEHLFSRRCLYFAEGEAFFSCAPKSHLSSGDVSESFRTAYVLEHRESMTKIQSRVEWNHAWVRNWDVGIHPGFQKCDARFDTYAREVASYTQRELSNDSDILAAFAGVLAKYCTCLRDRERVLRHGLFSRNIQRALLWAPAESAPLRKRATVNPVGGSKFPSWSWVSWRGAVQYHTISHRQISMHGEVYDGSNVNRLEIQKTMEFEQLNDFDVVGKPSGRAGSHFGSILKFESSVPLLSLFTNSSPVRVYSDDSGRFQVYGAVGPPLATFAMNSGPEDRFTEGDFHFIVIAEGTRDVDTLGQGRAELVVLLVREENGCLERVEITVLPRSRWRRPWVDPRMRWIQLR